MPLPSPVRETTRHVWIRRDDPGLVDLINDARHYADPVFRGEEGMQRYRTMAQALLRALEVDA